MPEPVDDRHDRGDLLADPVRYPDRHSSPCRVTMRHRPPAGPARRASSHEIAPLALGGRPRAGGYWKSAPRRGSRAAASGHGRTRGAYARLHRLDREDKKISRSPIQSRAAVGPSR
jgi:hypothetical protein